MLYCVLFLRTSDVDRSGADDQSSPASPGDSTPAPPGGSVPAGAALLLGGPQQTALTELLRKRLTEMQLDGAEPGQERTEAGQEGTETGQEDMELRRDKTELARRRDR